MSDKHRPDGRVVRGYTHDTLHPDDSLFGEWLRRILKPESFDGPNVVLPREAMDGLVDMCRRRGFVIDAGDG